MPKPNSLTSVNWRLPTRQEAEIDKLYARLRARGNRQSKQVFASHLLALGLVAFKAESVPAK